MLTVLIVDDNPDARLLLRQILQHGGYATLEAADGREALAVLAQRTVDIAILDLNMPGMSGPDFLKAVRADAGLRNLTVVISTATPENRAIRDFMEIFGVHYIIPKPSEPQDVLDILARVTN